MICTPGQYRAKAVSPATIGKSSKKETPGVTVSLRLEEGPNKGAIVEWRSYLSENAKARTIEGLVLMGFDGEDPSTVMKNEIIAVVDNETNNYKNDKGEEKTYTEARVQFINDPARGAGAKFLPLSDAERAIISGDIRAAVAAHKAGMPAAGSDPTEFPPKDAPQTANGPKLKF